MAQELTFNISEDRRKLQGPVEAKNFNLKFGTDGVAITHGNPKQWVQGRIGDEELKQVFVNITEGEDNTPKDVAGMFLAFVGIIHDKDGRPHRVVDYKHSTTIDVEHGRFRFDFPDQAFTVAGEYQQAFFMLIKEGPGGGRVATMEFDMQVMANFVFTDLVPEDYITPFNDTVDQLLAACKKFKDDTAADEAKFKQELEDTYAKFQKDTNTQFSNFEDATNDDLAKFKKANADDIANFKQQYADAVKAKQDELQSKIDSYTDKLDTLLKDLNQQGIDTTTLMSTLQVNIKSLEDKIKQDGLFTQAEADQFKKSVLSEADQFKKSVLSVAVNSFENVDEMSKSTDLAEGVTVKTQGYYAKGDGGAATYKIGSVPTDFTIKLDNGLYADPVKDGTVTPNMFGARDNVKYQPSIDSTDAFRKALAFSDHVSVPEGSYKVQGLNIPAKKVLAGSGQYATILYGYGDDIIKFTDSSYNNVLSDLKINADAGFAAVHCKYAPASGDPFDAHNRIENVQTSGGKYGFFVEYPSRGVMIVNGYASGVSDTLFYIQGTDNNLVSCGGRDAPKGYELQNNNTMTSCGCFAISDRAVILRGSWCQVTSFIGQDCQSGFYIPSQSNVVTGKLDRMGYYTPGSKSYDVMLTETSRNNSISLSVTEGRQPSNGDKKNGKSYVETILNVSNAIAAQNIINITANILNDVTPTLCNRASEDLFVRNNDVYINGKLLSDLRYSQLSRKEIVDVTVSDGGTFTPSVAGQLIITTNHTKDGVWAVCTVKTQAYFNGSQQYLYAKHGYGRLRETVQVPVSAGETVVFQENNTAAMTMSAKFVPYK